MARQKPLKFNRGRQLRPCISPKHHVKSSSLVAALWRVALATEVSPDEDEKGQVWVHDARVLLSKRSGNFRSQLAKKRRNEKTRRREG
jgi:hypothetical protein